jgi:hypothetical protein
MEFHSATCPQAFNARGSRLMIVVGQLEAVKILVASVEALGKKKR